MHGSSPDTETPCPQIRLENYLPYRLSVAANTVSSIVARAYQERFDLSVWEWRVIAVLSENATMTAQQICEATATDKVTVSRAIRSLNERGLVKRRESPQDRRARNVALTEAGTQMYQQIAPIALEYEASILKALSPDEHALLITLLKRLEEEAKSSDLLK